jgi:hypothetical protein
MLKYKTPRILPKLPSSAYSQMSDDKHKYIFTKKSFALPTAFKKYIRQTVVQNGIA